MIITKTETELDLLPKQDERPTVFVCTDAEFAALSDRKDIVILGYGYKIGRGWTVTISYDTRPYRPIPLSQIKVDPPKSKGRSRQRELFK